MTEPATTVLTPATQPEDLDPFEVAEAPVENTADTRRPLSKSARRRMTHRIVAQTLSDAVLAARGDSGTLCGYTEADADEILNAIQKIAEAHKYRSL